MRFHLSFPLVSGAAMLIAGPVLSAGLVPTPAPAPPPVFAPSVPVYDWTGFSGGVQLGYGDVESDDLAIDGDGAVYGLRAYYDYDFGQFVLGAGLQYDWADIELETDGGAVAATLDSVMRVGARAGFDSGRNWYYLTAGWAKADVDLEGGGDTDSDGYFYGLGYEVFVTDSITASAELLRHNFDDFDDLDDVEADATTASLAVNFRF